MDEILVSHLDRIESSLSDLVDSISSYNPSVRAAEALIQADDELQASLKLLQIHQRNEAHIQDLHRVISNQDQQIRSELQRLADARDELFAVPNSLPAPHRRNVDSVALLDFASRLSRYTVPPTLKPTTGQLAQNDATHPATSEEKTEGVGLAALVDEEKRWLDPWTGIQFTPWPGEEVIRSSALARSQAGGLNPDDALKDESAMETGAIPLGGEQALISEPNSRTLHDTEAAKNKEEKPKVFGGLDLYDPELDD